MTRYSANDDYFYPGIKVPRNKYDIKDESVLESVETYFLSEAYFSVLNIRKLKISKNDLFRIHSLIFSKLYNWAGKTRQVDISKNHTSFANWKYLDSLLDDWAKDTSGILSKIDASASSKEMSKAISTIMIEFLAIHPFRDGNGRTIRLIIDKIAYDLGYDLLWYRQTIDKKFIEKYMSASEQGVLKKTMLPWLK